MVKDWFDQEFTPHGYGENVLLKPDPIFYILHIPARINLRAVIYSERRIKAYERGLLPFPFDYPYIDKGETPSLFWSENLVPSDRGVYVFETKYCTEADQILPISHLNQIPERLARRFLRKVPPGVSELADRLSGTETDTRRLLRKFYEFVDEHEKYKSPTRGKPIEQLLEEYERCGYFYGNCKEARDFYVALCNSRGLPTKKVVGRHGWEKHVWVDVFVPSDNGYKLLPVDPAAGYFGDFDTSLRHLRHFDTMGHVFEERMPHIWAIRIIFDFITRRNYRLNLKIEPKD